MIAGVSLVTRNEPVQCAGLTCGPGVRRSAPAHRSIPTYGPMHQSDAERRLFQATARDGLCLNAGAGNSSGWTPGRSGVCCGGAEQNRPGARNKCKCGGPQKSRQTRHSRHKPAQPGTTRHGNGSGVTPSGLAPAGWYADEDCWPHRKTCFLRRDWMLGGRRLPWITNRPPALANGPAACLMPMLNGFNLSQPG